MRRMSRRDFLKGTLAAGFLLLALGQLPIMGPVAAATGRKKSKHAQTPALGPRWVWCQPIRGDWMYPRYSQSEMVERLGQFSRIDVLHRAVDQGFAKYAYVTLPGTDTQVPQYFTVSSLANTVKPWIKALRDSFPGTKVIGRISCGMLGYQSGRGLDPSDPDLQTPFQGFPSTPSPYDMRQAPGCISWLVDWGIRYYDNLGVDGIWYDNTKLLLHQSASNWDKVYSGIHEATGDSFWVSTNTSSTLKGMMDSVENNVGKLDVCDLAESVDWAAVEDSALALGDLPSPQTPLTLHLDYPKTMGKFAAVQQYGSTLSSPCLDFDQRAQYVRFFASDMQAKGYYFEWPVLAGDPGYGYDSIADTDPTGSDTNLFDQIVQAVNSLP